MNLKFFEVREQELCLFWRLWAMRGYGRRLTAWAALLSLRPNRPFVPQNEGALRFSAPARRA
jgi:hypothetical protein